MRNQRKTSIMEVLLIILFCFIIIFSLFTLLNTRLVNSNTQDTISCLKNSKIILIRNNLKDKQEQLIPKLDSAIIENNKRINEAINNLEKNKFYLVDANTMSFFFQIFAIFISGLGIFLLSKMENAIQISEKLKKRNRFIAEKSETLNIQNNNLIKQLEETEIKLNNQIKIIKKNSDIITTSNHILRNVESILLFSTSLKENKEINEYEGDNMTICHYISVRLKEIEKEREKTISSFCKSQCVSILYDTQKRFYELKLHEAGDYYLFICNSLEDV